MIASFPLWAYPAMEVVYQLDLGPRSGPFWACMALFFIPTCLLGAVFPFCIRLAISDLSRLGRGVGVLYGISTFGSLVGTLGAAFYLVGAMGTRSSLVLVGVLLLVCAGGGLSVEDSRIECRWRTDWNKGQQIIDQLRSLLIVEICMNPRQQQRAPYTGCPL